MLARTSCSASCSYQYFKVHFKPGIQSLILQVACLSKTTLGCNLAAVEGKPQLSSAVLAPVVEAARLPRVCPMALGYGLPPCNNNTCPTRIVSEIHSYGGNNCIAGPSSRVDFTFESVSLVNANKLLHVGRHDPNFIPNLPTSAARTLIWQCWHITSCPNDGFALHFQHCSQIHTCRDFRRLAALTPKDRADYLSFGLCKMAWPLVTASPVPSLIMLSKG